MTLLERGVLLERERVHAAELREIARHPRCAAIGETGLDDYRDYAPRADQERAFAAHIGLARELGKLGFAESDRQAEIVEAFAKGELDWPIDVSRAWSVVMRAALAAFYSHPWAFNEIGFGGPSYPRGYMRRNMGPAGREPYEPRETR